MHGRLLLLGLILGASADAQTAPAPAVEGPVPHSIPLGSFTRFEEFGGMKISPDGKYLHLILADHNIRRGRVAREEDPYMKARIYRIDTYTGDGVQIDIAPVRGALLLLDNARKPRFAVGLNEFSILGLRWKQQPDSAWASVFLEELRNESVVPLRFSADDRSIFLRGVREGTTFA